MLVELHVPMQFDENSCRRHSLLLKDRKFHTSSFSTDINKLEEFPINDCIIETQHHSHRMRVCTIKHMVLNWTRLFKLLEISQNHLWKMMLIASGNSLVIPLFGDVIKIGDPLGLL